MLFACWHAGMTAVPMNAKLHAKEFAYILENSGAKAVLRHAAICSRQCHRGIAMDRKTAMGEADRSPADVEPDDAAWLFYTSGTTGVPKGAMLTHRNMLFQTHAYFADIDKLAPERHRLHPAPLSHGSGFYGAAALRRRRGERDPGERPASSPAEIFELLDHWPNASFFAAPTMVVRLLASPAARTPQQPEDDHLRRRADVRRRLPARDRALRPAPLPALRPGRGADDDHRAAAGISSTGIHGQLATCGFARTGVRSEDLRRRRIASCPPAKSARSSRAPIA